LHDAFQGAVRRCLKFLIPRLDSYRKALERRLEERTYKEELESEESKPFPQKEEKKEELEWSWERWKQHIGETEEHQKLFQELKVIDISDLIAEFSASSIVGSYLYPNQPLLRKNPRIKMNNS
jgi:hypothetical protein